jgi:methylated-DNA-protein-cysteine methyltransferase-like protein
MPFRQENFDKAIWNVVSSIPPGRVMGYGEVARAAGYPRHTRMVSKAMSRSDSPLPWYRVVRSNRTLAFEIGSKPYNKQKALLEKEGVRVIKGKVIPLESDDDQGLDELVWGPGDS